MALGGIAGCAGFECTACSLVPGWCPPGMPRLPVSEGPSVGPGRAPLQYGSGNTARPAQTQQHGLWISAVSVFPG